MERPASVRRSIWLAWCLVALSAVAAVVTVLLRDDLVTTWAEGNRTARDILREGGLEALDASDITVPGFVPLALVAFVVVAMLMWVLVVFLNAGHGWARWSIVPVVLFAAFLASLAFTRDPPAAFVVLATLSLVVDAALLYYLFHKDTSAYLRVG